MNDPLFTRAEEALVALEQRTRYDEKNRLELLAVHGFKGLFVGLMVFLYGGPDAWDVLYGPDTSLFLSAPAFFGGLTLLIGLGWNRNILLEAFGMCSLLMWDGLMFYCLARAGQNPYVLGVYGAMALLMLIHLRTLAKYLLARKDALDAE